MDQVGYAIAGLCAAIATGSIVFQSFIVAPAVFSSLETDAARSFLRTLFPRFFRLNLVVAALGCGALLASGLANGWSILEIWGAVATALVAVSMLVSLSVVPTINRARDAGPEGDAAFRRLHKLTVMLTVLALLLSIAVLVAIAGTSAGY